MSNSPVLILEGQRITEMINFSFSLNRSNSRSRSGRSLRILKCRQGFLRLRRRSSPSGTRPPGTRPCLVLTVQCWSVCLRTLKEHVITCRTKGIAGFVSWAYSQTSKSSICVYKRTIKSSKTSNVGLSDLMTHPLIKGLCTYSLKFASIRFLWHHFPPMRSHKIFVLILWHECTSWFVKCSLQCTVLTIAHFSLN